MVSPLVKHKVIHKRTKHFERHASHRFKRMGVRYLPRFDVGVCVDWISCRDICTFAGVWIPP
jgi:hypothetical protein